VNCTRPCKATCMKNLPHIGETLKKRAIPREVRICLVKCNLQSSHHIKKTKKTTNKILLKV
jgi:hypothetical protein